jgi:NADP-dependent 3-hydroxy acid dehydrogenase YdfG
VKIVGVEEGVNRFSVEGKLVLITGASRGIGLGAARALGESGAKVILVARKAEELERAAGELKAAGIEAVVYVLASQRVGGSLQSMRRSWLIVAG